MLQSMGCVGEEAEHGGTLGSFNVTSPVVGADILTSSSSWHKDSQQVLLGTKSKLSPSPAPSNHPPDAEIPPAPHANLATLSPPDHFSGGQKEKGSIAPKRAPRHTKEGKEKNFPFCLQDPVLQAADWPGSPFRGNADGAPQHYEKAHSFFCSHHGEEP